MKEPRATARGREGVTFADLDANGKIDLTNSTSTNEIIQENHYYAFGMAHEGPWLMNNGSAKDNFYQYNSKEYNNDHALNWNDYGARWYDPAIGRFTTVDAWADKYLSYSPYNYTFNNPIKHTDPTGNGPTGDIYSSVSGVHLGTDGVDDNRVYVSNSTAQLTEDQASAAVMSHDLVSKWAGSEGGGGLTELNVGHDAFQLLAATAYGESGNSDNSKEMFGIASAIINNNSARGENANLSITISSIANAASDGNARFGKFTESSLGERGNNGGMTKANSAAINALTGGKDYSNGATGWDGNDLPINSHRFGMNISNSSHDIYNIGDRALSKKENGSDYRRQSTAAEGSTMFYKIHPTYVKGGGRAY